MLKVDCQKTLTDVPWCTFEVLTKASLNYNHFISFYTVVCINLYHFFHVFSSQFPNLGISEAFVLNIYRSKGKFSSWWPRVTAIVTNGPTNACGGR